jgi:hypothetical protein
VDVYGQGAGRVDLARAVTWPGWKPRLTRDKTEIKNPSILLKKNWS